MIVVKVPGVNGLGKTSGTRDAGNKILEGVKGGLKLEEIHVDNGNLPEQEELILKNAKKLFDEEDKVIFLGGDHSISYPIGKRFFEKYPEGRMVVFDAHADCMKPMKEPTHEEWLGALVESGVDGKKIMVIGLNKVEDEEKEFMDEKGILREGDLKEFIGAHPTHDLSREEKRVPPTRPPKVSPSRSPTLQNSSIPLYVSFDIDVFKDAKATGYAEGKMEKEEVMEMLDVIVENGNVKGMDLVEVNLEKEGLDETLDLAREVLDKFLI